MAILGYRKKRGFSNLPGWLDVATGDLEPAARQRIASEIQNHYTDAIAAHLESGQTLPAAQANALAELGDPHAAAKRLRKSHLTIDEAKKIAQIEKEAARPLTSQEAIWTCWAPALMCPLLAIVTRGFARELCGAFAIGVLAMQLAPRLLYRLPNVRRNPRKPLATINLVGILAIITAFPVFVYLTDSNSSGAYWGALIGLAINSRTIITLWLKLRRMHQDPPKPPVSGSEA